MSKLVKSEEVTVRVKSAKLTIEVDKKSGFVDDVFTFKGFLKCNDEPVVGTKITLFKDGEVVGSSTTKEDGGWSISWKADKAGSFTFHAEGEVSAFQSETIIKSDL